MTGRIFISYRRSDSQFATDRIYERLADKFGGRNVFMDIDDIPLGVNFREYIDQQVSTSDVVIAIIGEHWLDATDEEGNPRLHNANDFVRLELEAALDQGIKLIPVFIGGVHSIPINSLPESLQELPMLNATRIRRGPDFLPDVDRLIRGIERVRSEEIGGAEGEIAVPLKDPSMVDSKISKSEVRQMGWARAVPVWGWITALIVILGVVFGLTFWEQISTWIVELRSAPTESVDDAAGTRSVSPTFTPTPGPDPDFISWMNEITLSAPNYLEDFSVSNASKLYLDAPRITDISLGKLIISDDPTTDTFYNIWGLRGHRSYLQFGSCQLIYQFEFTPNQFGFGSRLFLNIEVIGVGTYSFELQPDGNWRFSLGSGDNYHEDIATGVTTAMNLNETYHFQVFIWEEQLAFMQDGDLVLFSDISKGGLAYFELGLSSYKPLEVALDNIEYWDLHEYRYLETSVSDSAKTFYQPIREYLAKTPPDFQEEFEIPQPYWEEDQLYSPEEAGYATLEERVFGDHLYIDSTFQPAQNDELFNLQFSQMKGENIALQFDFRMIYPGSLGSVGVVKEGESSGEGYSYFCDFWPENEDIYCNLARWPDPVEENDNLQSSNLPLYADIDKVYTMFLIYYDSQFSAFLDGFFLGYVDGLDVSGQQIRISTVAGENLEVEFDNFKFWNLDTLRLDMDGNLPDEEVIAFYKPVLEYVVAELPSFEEDFENSKSYWSSMPVTEAGESGTKLADVVSTGTAIFESIRGNRQFRLYFDELNAENFFLQFDYTPYEAQLPVELSVLFGEALSESAEYHFVLRTNLSWLVWEFTEENIENERVGLVAGGTEAEHDYEALDDRVTVTLYVYNNQIVAFLNDGVLMYYDGLQSSDTGIRVYLQSDGDMVAEFDNFRFWNLDGVTLNP